MYCTIVRVHYRDSTVRVRGTVLAPRLGLLANRRSEVQPEGTASATVAAENHTPDMANELRIWAAGTKDHPESHLRIQVDTAPRTALLESTTGTRQSQWHAILQKGGLVLYSTYSSRS